MNRTTLTAACAALIAIAVGGYFWVNGQAPSAATNLGLGAASAQEADAEIDTSGVKEMVLGSDDAPLTVIEYASATCPHCANFHTTTFKPFKEAYVDTGKVKFIYREVFFDPYGVWAGAVARCDGGEKFFGIFDMIYTQQRQWVDRESPRNTADNLEKLGKVAGLAPDVVEACLQDEDMMRAMVAVFRQNAERDGIRSTPTFLVGDEKVEGYRSFEELSAIVDAALGN